MWEAFERERKKDKAAEKNAEDSRHGIDEKKEPVEIVKD